MMSVKFMFIFIGLCILCIILEAYSKNTECGKLNDKSQIPWTVGIYLEKQKDHLELVCLGTVLKDNYIITAAQCVCESLAKDVRKEHIFVSSEIQKQLRANLDAAVRVETKDVISRSDYEGFLINPAADLAVLKLKESQKIGSHVCVDWADLNLLLQGEKSGIFSVWDKQLKTLDISYLDYDSCTLSASEDFGRILRHDKNCFEVPISGIRPESIGSGIYFKNPKDDRWYLEGISSAKEKSKNEIFVAATSIRHYISWLSRVCA